MKNFILTLLNTILSNQTPDNYTKTTTEITTLGKVVIGIVISIILTLSIIGIAKIIERKQKDDDNHNHDNHNNNAKN